MKLTRLIDCFSNKELIRKREKNCEDISYFIRKKNVLNMHFCARVVGNASHKDVVPSFNRGIVYHVDKVNL